MGVVRIATRGLAKGSRKMFNKVKHCNIINLNYSVFLLIISSQLYGIRG